jgi:hypothetical protein
MEKILYNILLLITFICLFIYCFFVQECPPDCTDLSLAAFRDVSPAASQWLGILYLANPPQLVERSHCRGAVMPSIFCQPYFSDETAAFAELEAILWPDGPVCPH